MQNQIKWLFVVNWQQVKVSVWMWIDAHVLLVVGNPPKQWTGVVWSSLRSVGHSYRIRTLLLSSSNVSFPLLAPQALCRAVTSFVTENLCGTWLELHCYTLFLFLSLFFHSSVRPDRWKQKNTQKSKSLFFFGRYQWIWITDPNTDCQEVKQFKH